MTTRYADHVLSGTTAARPAATAVPVGTLYASSTDGVVYQSNGSAWASWLAAAGGGTTYRVGSGAPSSGLGALNDLYENLATGDLYQKQTLAATAAFRSVATGGSNSYTTSHSCSFPAGIVAGDVLIFAVSLFHAGGLSTPTPSGSGWTLQGGHSLSSQWGYYVWTKTADGSEGATVTYTTNVSAYSGHGVLAYSNTAGVDAFADYGSGQNTLTPTVPSVTCLAGSTVVGIVLQQGATAGTPAAGWTERMDASQAGGGFNVFAYAMDIVQATAGASPTATPTLAGSTNPAWTFACAVKASGGAPTVDWVRMFQLYRSGTTAARPTVTAVGQAYYDTTLGKPIWWNGSAWKDATGTTV